MILALLAAASCGDVQTPPRQAEQAEPAAKAAAPAAKGPAVVEELSNAAKGAEAVVAYGEFEARIQQYLQARTKAKAAAPPLGTKASAEEITAHKNVLAQKIREARASAKQGDIFTPPVSAHIKGLFRYELTKAPKAKAVRQTIQEGEPLKDIRLRVGMAYPDQLPITTMPPDLLKKLPRLPEEIAYRIVGHDLLLVDTDANIVVDFIPEAKP